MQPNSKDVPALECCKRAVRHVCADLRAGWACMDACASLAGPDQNPVWANSGRFAPGGSRLEEWREGVLEAGKGCLGAGNGAGNLGFRMGMGGGLNP